MCGTGVPVFPNPYQLAVDEIKRFERSALFSWGYSEFTIISHYQRFAAQNPS